MKINWKTNKLSGNIYDTLFTREDTTEFIKCEVIEVTSRAYEVIEQLENISLKWEEVTIFETQGQYHVYEGNFEKAKAYIQEFEKELAKDEEFWKSIRVKN